MKTNTDTRQFALQLFNGRTYETVQTGDYGQLVTAFDAARPRPRRLVLSEKNRPAKPRKDWHRAPALYSRSIDAVIDDYLHWAQKKGLARITVFDRRASCVSSLKAARGFELRFVDAEEYFAVRETIDAPAVTSQQHEVRP